MRTSCIQCVSLLLFSLFLSHIQEKNTFVSSLLELPAGAKVIRSWYRVGAEKKYIRCEPMVTVQRLVEALQPKGRF